MYFIVFSLVDGIAVRSQLCVATKRPRSAADASSLSEGTGNVGAAGVPARICENRGATQI
jgi:hypothetical protein